jgi:hypothetical protein
MIFIDIGTDLEVGVALVGIAMGIRLDGPGSIPGSENFFSSPQCPY